MYAFITDQLEALSYLIYFLSCCLFFYTDQLKKTTVLIAFYLLAGLTMCYSSYLAKQAVVNTHIYNYLLLPLSLGFLSVYFCLIIRNKIKRKGILILFVLNALVFVVKIILPRNNVFFDSTGFALLCITVIIYCFFFFYEKVEEMTDVPLHHNFDFWVACSFVINYAGCFLVYLTYYYLTESIYLTITERDQNILTLLWIIPNLLLFVSSLISLTGFLWIYYRNKLQ